MAANAADALSRASLRAAIQVSSASVGEDERDQFDAGHSTPKSPAPEQAGTGGSLAMQRKRKLEALSPVELVQKKHADFQMRRMFGMVPMSHAGLCPASFKSHRWGIRNPAGDRQAVQADKPKTTEAKSSEDQRKQAVQAEVQQLIGRD